MQDVGPDPRGRTDAQGVLLVRLMPGLYTLDAPGVPLPYVDPSSSGIAVCSDTVVALLLERGVELSGRLADGGPSPS